MFKDNLKGLVIIKIYSCHLLEIMMSARDNLYFMSSIAGKGKSRIYVILKRLENCNSWSIVFIIGRCIFVYCFLIAMARLMGSLIRNI